MMSSGGASVRGGNGDIEDGGGVDGAGGGGDGDSEDGGGVNGNAQRFLGSILELSDIGFAHCGVKYERVSVLRSTTSTASIVPSLIP